MFESKGKQIAAIYVRVSTEEQAVEGQSIPAQIDTLTQYCNLFGIQLYKTYKDLGISGKDTINRPGLNELIKDSKNGHFNVVLVWKISRLSRSLKDLLHMVDMFEKNGVNFISYSEKFDTSTPVGRMTLQILGSIAEFERNTIIENVKLGLGEVARQGRKTGGNVLGYDNVDKQLVINKAEADIVKAIFDLYVNQKMGLTKIVKQLSSTGYKTKRGGSFGIDTVGIILSNPIYIGKNRHQVGSENEYWVDAAHEPIIDITLWDKAQERRKQRSTITQRRHEAGTFLLSGILCCPTCGSIMGSAYTMGYKELKGGKKSYRYRYYKCSRYGRTRDCSPNWISADKIENSVIDYIANIANNPGIIKKSLQDTINKRKIETAPMRKDLEAIKKEIDKAKKTKEKLFDLYLSGKVNNMNDIITKINETDLQISTLGNRAEEYAAAVDYDEKGVLDYTTIEVVLKKFLELVKLASPEDKNILVRSLVKKVVINDSNQIEYIELQFGIGDVNKVYQF